MPQEALRREQLAHGCQALFADHGYQPIETPTLESFAVMEHGGHVPGAPFKLFDRAGELLAMRPDVTLQVARMCATRLKAQPGPFRFRYTQRIFRETEPQMPAREMTQVGIECIGEAGAQTDAELLNLLVEALTTCGLTDFTISIGTVSVLRELLDACSDDEQWKADVRNAFHTSNFVELDRLVHGAAAPVGRDDYLNAILALPRIRGGREAIDAVRNLVAPLGCAGGLGTFTDTFGR